MSKRIQEGTGEEHNYGKVKTDVEPGFEDCSTLFNSAESECIERPGDIQRTWSKLEVLKHVRGDLQLKIQIKMAQRRVLKCGTQMHRRTQVR